MSAFQGSLCRWISILYYFPEVVEERVSVLFRHFSGYTSLAS
uniref:Uncharacterized protein n=1 Tax=Anguilla anguilla TaxID=7936 RepID=A0A0E9SPI7_ANGAN